VSNTHNTWDVSVSNTHKTLSLSLYKYCQRYSTCFPSQYVVRECVKYAQYAQYSLFLSSSLSLARACSLSHFLSLSLSLSLSLVPVPRVQYVVFECVSECVSHSHAYSLSLFLCLFFSLSCSLALFLFCSLSLSVFGYRSSLSIFSYLSLSETCRIEPAKNTWCSGAKNTCAKMPYICTKEPSELLCVVLEFLKTQYLSRPPIFPHKDSFENFRVHTLPGAP